MPSGTTSLAPNTPDTPHENQIVDELWGSLDGNDQHSLQLSKAIPFFYFRLRGLLLLLLAIYWAIIPARSEADIVAGTIAYSILAFLFLSAVLTLIQGIRAKRLTGVSLQALPSPHIPPDVDCYSLEESPYLIHLRLPKLLPCFQYEFRMEFEHPLKERKSHILRGRLDKDISLKQSIIFPHRGVWRTSRAVFLYGDRFGLTAFRFQIHSPDFHHSFEVAPRMLPLERYPLLSASQTSGDEISAQYERRGDFLDIKPYHPADGTRRILWKVFAKSGELLTRHPERTYTPEGEALFYICASRYDDMLCGHFLTYLQHLTNHDLHFRVRCEGQDGQLPDATTLDEARALLIQAVWGADHYDLNKSCEEIHPLLTDNPKCLYIPFHDQRLALIKHRTLLMRIGNYITKHHTTPSFLIFRDKHEKTSSLQEKKALVEFERDCATRAWECIVIE